MTTPQGVLAVKVEQRSGIIGQLLDDQRKRTTLGLLASILFAVPLSYLLGGRTLGRRQRAADRLAGTDALTGIAGRRPFRPLLSAALADRKNTEVSLALIDIDHFKRVNDTLGHSYGDRVLVALGESFEDLRACDTAFRLGGDEFAVVLPGTPDREGVDILERVREAFARRMPGVSISCGVASVRREDAVSSQELWERADSALYQAKRLGRNRTTAFSTLTGGITVAADKLDAIHELCDSEIACRVVFQPIWDLRAGSLLGHEALLRLPSGTPLDGPAEAFELAARVGKAAELDAMARRVILRGVTAEPWPGGLLFINVHPAALREFDFDAFGAEVIAAGLAHADIVLEVTEQADLDNPTNVRALKRASARGFKLALDDLGAGNAGLRALTHHQFHIIKLDRQVISRLGIDPAADAVVAAATTFVRNTGGWVIAEGIEDRYKLEAVLDDSHWRAATAPPLAGQGYLLGYPDSVPQALDTRLDLLNHPPAAESPIRNRGNEPI
jgi:diguanylate cyclase (GGDEF)-like protein